MPSRRTIILSAAGLLGSAAFSSARATEKLTVIYVGGWDCPPCTEWKRRYKAQWIASPEYRKVAYFEVDAPKLKEAYQEQYWDDLTPILKQLPKKSGTPRFLVVKNDKLIANEFGVGGWPKILDTVKKELAATAI